MCNVVVKASHHSTRSQSDQQGMRGLTTTHGTGVHGELNHLSQLSINLHINSSNTKHGKVYLQLSTEWYHISNVFLFSFRSLCVHCPPL